MPQTSVALRMAVTRAANDDVVMRARIHGVLAMKSIKGTQGTELWPGQQRKEDRFCRRARQVQGGPRGATKVSSGGASQLGRSDTESLLPQNYLLEIEPVVLCRALATAKVTAFDEVHGCHHSCEKVLAWHGGGDIHGKVGSHCKKVCQKGD
jgi:hypothetical protein